MKASAGPDTHPSEGAVLLVWGVAEAAEPTGLVRGTVVEFGSGVPVAGARVSVGEEAVSTDRAGAFSLVVPTGTLDLAVEAEGYVTAHFPETLFPDVVVDVKYRLERWTWDEEVVVYGTARDEISRQVLTIDELERVPGGFGDPVRALQSLPSVARAPEGTGDIVVRGAEATNTAAYVDGIRVPFLFHLLVGRSVVDGALVDDVEFYPSAVPLQYGDVSQAVVNARTPTTEPLPGLHGQVHADLLDGGGSIAAGLGQGWAIRAGGRVSWLSALAAQGLRTYRWAQGANGSVPKVAAPYEDHLVRLSRQRDADRFTLTWLGARDGLRVEPADPETGVDEETLGYDPYLFVDQRFFRGQARWDHRVGEQGWSFAVTGGRDRQQNLIEGLGLLGATGVQYAELTRWVGEVAAEGRVRISDHARFRLGAEGIAAPSRIRPLLPISAIESASGQAASPTEVAKLYAGPYVEAAFTAGPVLLQPGFRTSFHHLVAWDVVPEPQLSATVSLSPVWSVVAFGGLASQSPDVAQIAQGYAVDALGVTRSGQTTLGLRARWPSGIGVELTGYETEMWDLVVREVRHQVVAGPPDPIPFELEPDTGEVPYGALVDLPTYRRAQGRAYGAELQLRIQPRGRHFGWVAASLGRSVRTMEGEQYRSISDIPANLVAVYGLGLPKGWSVSGRGQLASGLVFTPLHGAYAGWANDPQFLDYWSLDYAPLPGETNSGRYPPYARFDLRIDKTWTGRRARWTAYLDVYNVSNQHNPLWATYDWNYTELETRAYIPILPTFGLQVEY